MNFDSCHFLHDLNGLDGADHLEILKALGGFEGELEGLFGEGGREVSGGKGSFSSCYDTHFFICISYRFFLFLSLRTPATQAASCDRC